MPAPKIRGEYAQLAQIAKAFGSAADNTRNSYQRLKQNKEQLQSGDWLGKGAEAFYREVDGSVFPALQRLQKALSAAQSVTQQISQVIKTAETDAAAVFKLQTTGGSQGSGSGGGAAEYSGATENSGAAESGGLGFLGQVGGFFEGIWEGAKGMVGGLWHLVAHPIDTLKGIGYGITHPGELWDALKKPYVEDWQSGNYGRAIGRGTFEVAMLLLPGVGEAKAVGKGAEVAEVASAAARAGEAAEAARLAAKAGETAEAARLAAKAGEAAEAARLAAEMAETARLVAKGEEVAMATLKAGTRDMEIASEVFSAANKALALPDAPAAVSRFVGLDSAAIPEIVSSFGGDIGKVGEIPAELAGRRVSTIGRFVDVEAAGQAGARTLKMPMPAWSNELNALWVKEAVNNGDVFKLVTGVTDDASSLARAPEFGGISVYGRELDALQQAGYTRVGDYLIPPH